MTYLFETVERGNIKIKEYDLEKMNIFQESLYNWLVYVFRNNVKICNEKHLKYITITRSKQKRCNNLVLFGNEKINICNLGKKEYELIKKIFKSFESREFKDNDGSKYRFQLEVEDESQPVSGKYLRVAKGFMMYLHFFMKLD